MSRKQNEARVFDLSGHPMKGWILVKPAGLAEEKALRSGCA
jgi:hypothetical protein